LHAQDSVNDNVVADTVTNPDSITTLSLYHDTLFLRRTVNEYDHYTSYNYVYIDTNRSSKYYDWLTSFQFSEFNIRSLEAYGVTGVNSSDDLKENRISDLPKNWLPLYSLDSEHYIYKPSDFGNAGRRILSDSSFIKWYMDGPMPHSILSYTRKELEWHRFELELYDGVTETLIIYPLYEARQIYVFEFPNEDERYRYRLYIPASRARDFDIVVNTGNEKAWEYDFDLIDFEKLIGTDN